jgi:hypothetical protein
LKRDWTGYVDCMENILVSRRPPIKRYLGTIRMH